MTKRLVYPITLHKSYERFMHLSLLGPRALVACCKITTAKHYLPFLVEVAKQGDSLFVLATQFSAEFLATLEVNNRRNNIQAIPIRAQGDMIEKVLELTKGEPITNQNQLSKNTEGFVSNLPFLYRVIQEGYIKNRITLVEDKSYPTTAGDIALLLAD